MGSYKLYVAIMAIASIAAVQEANCAGGSTVYPTDEQYDVPEDVSKSEMEHHQCKEYKSKIWDKAFSNPAAMRLMEVTSETAKELGADEVCSDTTRVLLNFITVMATNPNAHYTLGRLNKMISFIVREADTTSDKFEETKQVFERISNDPEIRDYIKSTIGRTIDLLKEPEIRERLSRVIRAVNSMIIHTRKNKRSNRGMMG